MASGNATILAVEAALKYLYPNGEPPEIINEEYKLHKRLKKATNFVGEWAYVVVKNANPQGVSNNVANAQLSVTSSTFNRFQLTRNKFYGVTRIDGEAAAAAVKTEGALVDLVSEETLGIAQSVTHDIAVYEYGQGTATLGQLTGTSSGTTLTFTADTNMNNLELGMAIQLVSDNTTSPTTRTAGTHTSLSFITSIDRKGKTIVYTNPFTDGVTGDYVVRNGMAAGSATASTFFGLESYIAGGTSPGTIYSLNRNTDPVRLAGETTDYTGSAMEDAVLDASAQVANQGCGSPDILVVNPIRAAAMKRSVGGKIIYDRNNKASAGVGFDDLVFETESGTIDMVVDPYCPVSEAFLLNEKDWTLWSLLSAPNIIDDDGNKYLRTATDDSFEVRWRFYGAMKLTNPARQFKLTGFGK